MDREHGRRAVRYVRVVVSRHGSNSGPDPDDITSVSASDMSLVQVLERFRRKGWTANHQATSDARVRCGSCHAVSHARSIDIGAKHRTEGASDPQDMLYVFGFACPTCEAKGVSVAGYGPAASARDQALVAALGDDRHAIDPVATDPT